MGIDLTNGYNDLKEHIGHKIVCQPYGDSKDPVNIAIECETCNCVLLDFNQSQKAPSMEKQKNSKMIFKEDVVFFEMKIANWKADGVNKKDKKMIEAYSKDRQDLQKVLGYIKKGKYSQAGAYAYNLDTIVREQIPTEIYNIIMDAYDYSC